MEIRKLMGFGGRKFRWGEENIEELGSFTFPNRLVYLVSENLKLSNLNGKSELMLRQITNKSSCDQYCTRGSIMFFLKNVLKIAINWVKSYSTIVSFKHICQNFIVIQT